MRKLIMLFVLMMLTLHNVTALSCQAGRGACMASCVAQNCATGYCPSGPEGVCICSRCGQGPVWPK